MRTITASRPVLEPPTWAVLERHLFDLLDRAIEPFLDRYTRADGSLIWRDEFPGRDGADDFYESAYNWPLLYLLGGDDHLLAHADRLWSGITRQLTALGHVEREYEVGYDWFHQGEGNLFFYYLCLADPTRRDYLERARRFANFYTGDDPAAPNYDPILRIIRTPHNGSRGPRPGFFDGEPVYGWSEGMARYGLPYRDVPGVRDVADLKDPALARAMGAAMERRMGRGDVVVNLAATSLVTNAFLLTGEEKYRRWALDYVDAWTERARANGGLLPDNVGLSGLVGEYLGGKWYGGLYGWTWPHGFYNVGMAATVAAQNAVLLTGERSYVDLARAQLDRVLAEAVVRDTRELAMSLPEHWIGQLAALGDETRTLVMPYRYGDAGWFDFQPVSPIYPTAIWALSLAAKDWERIARIRAASGYDWTETFSFRTKEDGGHEPPWLAYLAGENPGYPEDILRASAAQVTWHLDQIRADRADLTRVGIHHWQAANPVVTEALVQLTLGAPQVIYNGGLLLAPLRYFDADRRRPGLPRAVAALVRRLEAERIVVELVNLDPVETRRLVLQAGAFGEHRFGMARFTAGAEGTGYPGEIGAYAPPSVEETIGTAAVGGRWLEVRLPPSTSITLELTTDRFVERPIALALSQGGFDGDPPH